MIVPHIEYQDDYYSQRAWEETEDLHRCIAIIEPHLEKLGLCRSTLIDLLVNNPELADSQRAVGSVMFAQCSEKYKQRETAWNEDLKNSLAEKADAYKTVGLALYEFAGEPMGYNIPTFDDPLAIIDEMQQSINRLNQLIEDDNKRMEQQRKETDRVFNNAFAALDKFKQDLGGVS